jgi:hypothetical protein
VVRDGTRWCAVVRGGTSAVRSAVQTLAHRHSSPQAKHYLATNSSGGPAASYAGGFTYDLFNPDARAYAWSKMQEGFVYYTNHPH